MGQVHWAASALGDLKDRVRVEGDRTKYARVTVGFGMRKACCAIQERWVVRPILRRQPGPVAGSGRIPRCATRREPGWVSDPLTVTRF